MFESVMDYKSAAGAVIRSAIDYGSTAGPVIVSALFVNVCSAVQGPHS